MEQTKKRHNPPVNDDAVKAFDAQPKQEQTQTLKSSLDQEIQKTAQEIAVKKYKGFFEGFALTHHATTSKSRDSQGLCGLVDQENLDKLARTELTKAGEEVTEEKVDLLKEYINYVTPAVRVRNSHGLCYARLVTAWFSFQYTVATVGEMVPKDSNAFLAIPIIAAGIGVGAIFYAVTGLAFNSSFKKAAEKYTKRFLGIKEEKIN